MGDLKTINVGDLWFTQEAMADAAEKGMTFIPTAAVKILLGGQWPSEEESGGFNFDAVNHYRIEHDEEQGAILVPYDGFNPAPGPDFKLVMIPFL